MTFLTVLAVLFVGLAALILCICVGAMLGLTAHRFATHTPFDEEEFAIGGAMAFPVLVMLVLMVTGVIA